MLSTFRLCRFYLASCDSHAAQPIPVLFYFFSAAKRQWSALKLLSCNIRFCCIWDCREKNFRCCFDRQQALNEQLARIYRLETQKCIFGRNKLLDIFHSMSLARSVLSSVDDTRSSLLLYVCKDGTTSGIEVSSFNNVRSEIRQHRREAKTFSKLFFFLLFELEIWLDFWILFFANKNQEPADEKQKNQWKKSVVF